MALMDRDTVRRKPGTRSNTKLVVSGGMSPAGQWQTDRNLPVLFTYEYGGPGQKEVVISKGMMVAALPPVRFPETEKKRTVLTIADAAGLDNRKFAIGMAPYNFTKNHEDFLDGNMPSIITREYVELPLFNKPEDAAMVKWGAVHGDGTTKIQPGDYLKISGGENAGKLTRWVPGTDPEYLRVAQVLELEDDQEPWGWLKWAQWDEATISQDQRQGPLNRSGYAAPGEAGYPYDPEFKDPQQVDKDGYNTFYTTNPTGIPGILDGSQKALTQQAKDVTLVKGMVTAVDLGFKNLQKGKTIFAVGANQLTEVQTIAELSAGKFYVDEAKGMLYYNVDSAVTETIGKVTFYANFYGTPAGWDHKGSTGVVRILLKF